MRELVLPLVPSVTFIPAHVTGEITQRFRKDTEPEAAESRPAQDAASQTHEHVIKTQLDEAHKVSKGAAKPLTCTQQYNESE